MRQAIGGMLWSKQFFFFDGDNWLDEHQSNSLHSGYFRERPVEVLLSIWVGSIDEFRKRENHEPLAEATGDL